MPQSHGFLALIMQTLPASLRFPILLACLLFAACLSSPLTCQAQDRGGAYIASSGEMVAASPFVRDVERAETGRPGRPEITAFSRREVVFGLFVLIVGFLGLLVFLPAGIKSGGSRRQGHRGA